MADQDSHGLSGLVPGVLSSSNFIQPFFLNLNKASVTKSPHRPDPWRQPVPSHLPGHGQPWQGPQPPRHGTCTSWQNPCSGGQNGPPFSDSYDMILTWMTTCFWCNFLRWFRMCVLSTILVILMPFVLMINLWRLCQPCITDKHQAECQHMIWTADPEVHN